MGRKTKPTANIFVALLRGINVGGNNMISMRSLKVSFEEMGFADVTTYINSGNIIFKTNGDARKLERDIEGMLSRDYELECKVVVRSFPEIATLVEHLPKEWTGDARWKFNVIFLKHAIDSRDVLDELDLKNDIEQAIYRPGALLWSARTSDLTRTSMVKFSSRKIYQDVTVRNLNTTRKIYELMKKMSESLS